MEATRVGTELTGGPGVLAVSHGPTEAGSVVTKANACIIHARMSVIDTGMDGAVLAWGLLRYPGVPATPAEGIAGAGGAARQSGDGGDGETAPAWETDLAGSVHNCAFALIRPMATLLASTMAFSVFADTPREGHSYVPFGAYLSWELPFRSAQYNKLDRWQDVRRRLDLCVEHHINTLWVTNMFEEDLPRLIKECEKRGLKLLPMMSGLDARCADRFGPGQLYWKAAVPRIVGLAGDSKDLIGWVLTDEPKQADLEHVNVVHEMVRQEDPRRFCLVVSQFNMSRMVAQKLNLPVMCVDLYPFFGPNDVNGPHTDVASRNWYRSGIRQMIAAIGESKRSIVPWVMGQCFSDVMGPYRYGERGHVIALPGSYYHWRCPTLAEMRWQVWEAFRGQAKGIFFYQIGVALGGGPETSSKPSPDPWWVQGKTEILMTEPTDTGPSALITIDAEATPQLVELGKLFKRLAPHTELILRWQAHPGPIVAAESPASVQAFTDPTTGRAYVVVLNDDLREAKAITLRFSAPIRGLSDIILKQPVSVADEADAAGVRATIRLRPGDGTILGM